MSISRIEPWSLVNLINRDLNRYADSSVADWVPAVDVIEQNEGFVLRADLPGVDADNIDINMENGTLSISGVRAVDETGEAEGVKRIERASGKFYRRFNLPETADAESITAKTANGILEIRIPKQAEIQARRITVEAA